MSKQNQNGLEFPSTEKLLVAARVNGPWRTSTRRWCGTMHSGEVLGVATGITGITACAGAPELTRYPSDGGHNRG